MSEPKKKIEPKGVMGTPSPVGNDTPEPKTELPDTRHHYDPVGSLTNPKPVKKEALKEDATSQNDALGATAQS